jgi:LPXTG-motif cell wall-anchored protein
MNWIERLFGIEPDFGSGSLEMLIVGALIAVAGVVISRRRKSGAEEKVR